MNKPIGIFDSGIGGLNILNYLKQLFKNENFIYLGDTLYYPYGEKKEEVIRKRIEYIIKFFESKRVKLIIIACNTASSFINEIKSTIPVIDIITPTIERAFELSIKKQIGIVGTNLLIKRGFYQKKLEEKKVKASTYPLSKLVIMIEKNPRNKRKMKILIKNAKNKIGEIDLLILACTHFSYCLNLFEKEFNNIQIIDSVLPICERVKEQIKSNDINYNEKRYIDIYVTKNSKNLKRNISSNLNVIKI